MSHYPWVLLANWLILGIPAAIAWHFIVRRYPNDTDSAAAPWRDTTAEERPTTREIA